MIECLSFSFIARFLGLFDAPDSRERDYIKTIFHQIYAKYMSLRPYLRT